MNDIQCPICGKGGFASEKNLISHVRLSRNHDYEKFMKDRGKQLEAKKVSEPLRAKVVQPSTPAIKVEPRPVKQEPITLSVADEPPPIPKPLGSNGHFHDIKPFPEEERGAYNPYSNRNFQSDVDQEVERRLRQEQYHQPAYEPVHLSEDQLFYRKFLQDFHLPRQFVSMEVDKSIRHGGRIPTPSELSASIRAYTKIPAHQYLIDTWSDLLVSRQRLDQNQYMQQMYNPYPPQNPYYSQYPSYYQPPSNYDGRPKDTPSTGFISELQKFIEFSKVLQELAKGGNASSDSVYQVVRDAIQHERDVLENTRRIVQQEVSGIVPRALSEHDVESERIRSNYQLELKKLQDAQQSSAEWKKTALEVSGMFAGALGKTAEELQKQPLQSYEPIQQKQQTQDFAPIPSIPQRNEKPPIQKPPPSSEKLAEGICPHCNAPITFPKNADVIICPSCSKQASVTPKTEPEYFTSEEPESFKPEIETPREPETKPNHTFYGRHLIKENFKIRDTPSEEKQEAQEVIHKEKPQEPQKPTSVSPEGKKETVEEIKDFVEKVDEKKEEKTKEIAPKPSKKSKSKKSRKRKSKTRVKT